MTTKSTTDYLFTPGDRIAILTRHRIVIGRLRGVNYRGFLIDLEQNGEMEFVDWRHAENVRVNPSEDVLADWTQQIELRTAERAEDKILDREERHTSLKITKAQANILERDSKKG